MADASRVEGLTKLVGYEPPGNANVEGIVKLVGYEPEGVMQIEGVVKLIGYEPPLPPPQSNVLWLE